VFIRFSPRISGDRNKKVEGANKCHALGGIPILGKPGNECKWKETWPHNWMEGEGGSMDKDGTMEGEGNRTWNWGKGSSYRS
jgi:hypothetical protein